MTNCCSQKVRFLAHDDVFVPFFDSNRLAIDEYHLLKMGSFRGEDE